MGRPPMPESDRRGMILAGLMMMTLLITAFFVDDANAVAPAPDSASSAPPTPAEDAEIYRQIEEFKDEHRPKAMMAPPVHSNPLRGCEGKYRRQSHQWNQRTEVYVLQSPDPWPEPVYMYHTSEFRYMHCPYVGGARRIQGQAWEHCHVMGRNNLSRQYDGTFYEPYLYDSSPSGKNVNLGRIWGHEGVREERYFHCVFQVIPLDERKWMKTKHFPRWNLRSKNRLEGRLPDNPWVNWDTPQGEVRFVHAKTDTVDSPWYRPR